MQPRRDVQFCGERGARGKDFLYITIDRYLYIYMQQKKQTKDKGRQGSTTIHVASPSEPS